VDADFAHLAEGNARQARKRVAADVLIRDEVGRVLVVDPTYKEGLDLPGGMVEANESPQSGALREIGEELGLTRVIGPPLVVEWVGAHGPWDDQIVFVFDGGVMTASEIASIRVADPEIASWAFRHVDDVRDEMRGHIWQRLRAAVDAATGDSMRYRERDS
jgi:8-oxo-dGTP pyrophosphatase MutT (NUDIX family)